MSKQELDFNIKMLGTHRAFVASHDEMIALKARLNIQRNNTPPIPENLESRIDKMVEELKKEMKDGL